MYQRTNFSRLLNNGVGKDSHDLKGYLASLGGNAGKSTTLTKKKKYISLEGLSEISITESSASEDGKGLKGVGGIGASFLKSNARKVIEEGGNKAKPLPSDKDSYSISSSYNSLDEGSELESNLRTTPPYRSARSSRLQEGKGTPTKTPTLTLPPSSQRSYLEQSSYRPGTVTSTLVERRQESRGDAPATYATSMTNHSTSRQTSRDRQEHTYTPKPRAASNILETPLGTTLLTVDDLVSGAESSLLEENASQPSPSLSHDSPALLSIGDLANLTSEDEQEQEQKPENAGASEGIVSYHEESDAYSEDFESEDETEVVDKRESPRLPTSTSSDATPSDKHSSRNGKQKTEDMSYHSHSSASSRRHKSRTPSSSATEHSYRKWRKNRQSKQAERSPKRFKNAETSTADAAVREPPCRQAWPPVETRLWDQSAFVAAVSAAVNEITAARTEAQPVSQAFLPAAVLEKVTSFNPCVNALENMLRQQLQLTREFLNAQTQLHYALTSAVQKCVVPTLTSEDILQEAKYARNLRKKALAIRNE
ncbi:hypothetical protein AAHC03_012919 [Spirometra sp. Aus1]